MHHPLSLTGEQTYYSNALAMEVYSHLNAKKKSSQQNNTDANRFINVILWNDYNLKKV